MVVKRIEFLQLPRLIKQIFVCLVDVALFMVGWLITSSLLLDEIRLDSSTIVALIMCISAFFFNFVYSGMYASVFRYAEWYVIKTVLKALVSYGIFATTINHLMGFSDYKVPFVFIHCLVLAFLIGAARLAGNYFLDSIKLKRGSFNKNKKGVVIYGAGVEGRQIASWFGNEVVAFLDDDLNIQSRSIKGIFVYPPDQLPGLITKQNVDLVLLAINKISSSRRFELVDFISSHGVAVRSVPSIRNLMMEPNSSLASVGWNVNDLLGREEKSDCDLDQSSIDGAVIVVTGAGGSIGGELACQIFDLKPKKLVLYEWNEYALFGVLSRINRLKEYSGYADVEVTPILASVNDLAYLQRTFKKFKPDIVYHAAAYKHVGLVEDNVCSAVINNIFGTVNVCVAATEFGVGKFVLISSDKAVKPINVMGSTKKISELVVKHIFSRDTGLRFAIVRFGNVLESSGSVIPIFKQQIAAGGPVTVTDVDATRYFMTIPEAVRLVLKAGEHAGEGDLFILDMGEPVKIIDLATRMIQLSGYSIKQGDADSDGLEIKVIGLRPGEKLHEELHIDETCVITKFDQFCSVREPELDLSSFEQNLAALRIVAESGNDSTCRRKLMSLVDDLTLGNDCLARSSDTISI